MVLEFWRGGIKKQRLHIRLESLRFSVWFKKAFTRQDAFLRAGFSHRISRFLPSRSRCPEVLRCEQRRRPIAMAARTRTSQRQQACYFSALRRELNRTNCLADILKLVRFQLFHLCSSKPSECPLKTFFCCCCCFLVSVSRWCRGFHLNIQTFCRRLLVTRLCAKVFISVKEPGIAVHAVRFKGTIHLIQKSEHIVSI